MKKFLFSLFYLLITCTYAHAANCGGETACSCGDTVTSDYTLSGDLNCTNAGVILTIGANNVTLDLADYTIDGDDVNTVTCVDVNNFTGVTISNGTITDCTTDGVQFRGTSTGTISNITTSSHGNQGIQLENSASVTITACTSNDNADDGLSLINSAVAVVSESTFNGNAEGINNIADTTLTMTNSVALNNTSFSIRLLGETGTVLATVTNFTTNTRLQTIQGCELILHGANIYNVSAQNMIETNPGAGVGHLTLTGSVLHGIDANKYGVAIRAGSVSTVDNNTFYDDGDGKGILAAANITVNNTIFSGLATGIERTAGTVVANNSLFYNNSNDTVGTVTENNSVAGDPLFADPTNNNFIVKQNSPTRGVGTNVSLVSDYCGVPWLVIPDIGAFQTSESSFMFGGTGFNIYSGGCAL